MSFKAFAREQCQASSQPNDFQTSSTPSNWGRWGGFELSGRTIWRTTLVLKAKPFTFTTTSRYSGVWNCQQQSEQCYFRAQQIRRPNNSSLSALLLKELLDETQNTLALLFSRTSVELTAWLRAKSKEQILDPNLQTLRAAPRDSQGYDHWHDNLCLFLRSLAGHNVRISFNGGMTFGI